MSSICADDSTRIEPTSSPRSQVGTTPQPGPSSGSPELESEPVESPPVVGTGVVVPPLVVMPVDASEVVAPPPSELPSPDVPTSGPQAAEKSVPAIILYRIAMMAIILSKLDLAVYSRFS